MESLFQAFAWKAAQAGSGREPDSLPLCQPVLPTWQREDFRLFPSVALREFCWSVTCSPLGIFIVQYICSHGWGGSSAAPTYKAKLAWECAFLRLLEVLIFELPDTALVSTLAEMFFHLCSLNSSGNSFENKTKRSTSEFQMQRWLQHHTGF